MVVSPDVILQSLGRYSKWQMLMYSLLSISIWTPTCWQMLTVVFIGAIPPKYYCDRPANQTNFIDQYNITIGKCKQFVTPNGGADLWDNTTNVEELKTIECEKYHTDPDYGTTIHTEWRLFCEEEQISAHSQVGFQITMIIGVLVASPLCDRFGRKRVHLISLILMMIAGCLTAFSPNIWAFLIFRSATGLFREGTAYGGVIAAAEMFPAEQRSFAGIAHEFSWGFGMVTLALLAYFIRNWRILQLVLSITPLVLLSYFWILPESITWLISTGKPAAAKSILEGAFKFNKKPLPEEVENLDKIPLEELVEKKPDVVEDDPRSNYSLLDLFRSRIAVTNTLVMWYLWFVTTMVYYGLSLNTGSLAGDRYVNFLLSGVAEIIAFAVCLIIVPRIGRKIPLMVCSTMCGISLGVIYFIPDDLGGLKTVLATLGKLFITGNFAIIIAMAPEIFPTKLRGIGVGTAVMCGRLGGILSPYYYLVGKFVPWLPMMASAVLSIVAAVLTVFLPETLHRALPENIAEIEAWNRTKTRRPTDDSSTNNN